MRHPGENQGGTQLFQCVLDAGFHRHDGLLTFYEFINNGLKRCNHFSCATPLCEGFKEIDSSRDMICLRYRFGEYFVPDPNRKCQHYCRKKEGRHDDTEA